MTTNVPCYSQIMSHFFTSQITLACYFVICFTCHQDSDMISFKTSTHNFESTHNSESTHDFEITFKHFMTIPAIPRILLK